MKYDCKNDCRKKNHQFVTEKERKK